MRLSWVQFLMLFPFLDCLHNGEKRGHYIWVTSASLMCFLLRGWSQIAGKCSLISATHFGHFFVKLHAFLLLKTRKMRRNVRWPEIMTFTLLLSLKSEVASDIAHWYTMHSQIRTIWISKWALIHRQIKLFSFLCYSTHCEYGY